MRVGINATFLSEKPTGAGMFTLSVSEALTRKNRDTVIFSPYPFGSLPGEVFRIVPQSVRGSLRLYRNALRACYINTALPLLCRRRHRDVLYCPIAEFPFLPLVPLVVHVHDLHPLRFPQQFGLASTYFRLSLLFMPHCVSRITVSSSFVKRELMDVTGLSGDLIDVAPLAYDRDVYFPRGGDERSGFLMKYGLPEKYILCAGNLFPYKNVPTLIDAFLRIRHLIDHHLVVVGRREYARDPLPADERIHYTDYVPIGDMPMFYSFADLFVHPSTSEGFGITPLEAMACGTPVVSSNAASLPEVIGDGGLLFDPGDGDALSRIIVNVLQDRALQRDLRQRGLKQAEKFSWERTADLILRSCERAVGGTA